MKLITTLTFLLLSLNTFCQVANFSGRVTNYFLELEIDEKGMPVAATEVTLKNIMPKASDGYLEFRLNKDCTTLINTQVDKVKVTPEQYYFTLAGGKELTKSFTINIDPEIEDYDGKEVCYDIFIHSKGEEKKFNRTLKIKLSKYEGATYSLEEFKKIPKVKLDLVTHVTSDNNLFTVYGYKAGNGEYLLKRNILLKKNESLSIFNKAFRPALSIITVPLKSRPGEEDRATVATSGFNNLGLNFEVPFINSYRYTLNGNVSRQTLSFGLLLGASVMALDSIQTKGYIENGRSSKQAFFSAGFTITYSFNNICLSFIPAGADFSTSDIGDKWIHNGNYWWGFGIGINPRIFSSRFKR